MNSVSSARKQPSRLLEIDQTRLLSVRVPVGSAVHCVTGRVWLTQEGLLDDIVLAAGEKFAVQQKGIIVMSGVRGAALVYLSGSTQERADEAVIFTRDFLEAARTRAAELRHEELARLAGVARDFVMRLVKRIKAIGKTARPAFQEKPGTETSVAGF
ncbi:MAG: DUF2917 domain-containing protein [Pseudomonadota bacterium]